MKLIYFTNNLEGKDGWSRHSRGVIGYFASKYEVVVLVSRLNPDLKIKQLPILREPEVYLTKPWLVFWDLLKVRKIVSGLSKNSREKVIVHFLLEPYALFLALLKKEFRAIITLHGTYAITPLKSLKTRFLARRYFRIVDKIVAVSSFTREFFLKEFPNLISKDKFVVINNGINYQEIVLSPRPNKTKRILFVGMVKNRKGIHHLLEATARLRAKFKDFQVDIVGRYDAESEYLKKLQKIISDNDLNDFVKFRGGVSEKELDRYYREADVLVMPSVNEGYNFEGFGIVYLEANMYGVPAIGSRESGARDAIIEGKTGFLVDPYNHEMIADRIMRSDTIKLDDCREWARKNDWLVKNKRLEEIYRNI